MNAAPLCRVCARPRWAKRARRGRPTQTKPQAKAPQQHRKDTIKIPHTLRASKRGQDSLVLYLFSKQRLGASEQWRNIDGVGIDNRTVTPKLRPATFFRFLRSKKPNAPCAPPSIRLRAASEPPRSHQAPMACHRGQTTNFGVGEAPLTPRPWSWSCRP